MKKLLFVIILAMSLPTITFAQGGLGDGFGDEFGDGFGDGFGGGGNNNNEGTDNNTENNPQNNPTSVPISNLALVLIGGAIGTTLLIKARKKVTN